MTKRTLESTRLCPRTCAFSGRTATPKRALTNSASPCNFCHSAAQLTSLTPMFLPGMSPSAQTTVRNLRSKQKLSLISKRQGSQMQAQESDRMSHCRLHSSPFVNGTTAPKKSRPLILVFRELRARTYFQKFTGKGTLAKSWQMCQGQLHPNGTKESSICIAPIFWTRTSHGT